MLSVSGPGVWFWLLVLVVVFCSCSMCLYVVLKAVLHFLLCWGKVRV